jgi:adenylate cyclase
MTTSNRLHRLTPLRDVLITSLTVTGVLLGVQQLGGLQPLELVAFDTMVRLRPDRGVDPRLLVVTITESDIRQLQRWPPSDQTVAQVLQALQQHQPQVIGLDLFRDIPNPPGHTELVQQLQQDNVIAITFISANDMERVDPPPTVPEERIGFSNVSLDSDGRVRRFLLFASDGKKAFTSFSLQLALAYMKAQGIEPQVTPTNEYQLDNTVFTQIKHNSGGYQSIDDRGYQILLNYRSPQQVARTVTLTCLLRLSDARSLVQT